MLKTMTDERTKQDTGYQALAGKNGHYAGPCPECGNRVIQYVDHYRCSNAYDGGCGFSISVADIKMTVPENVVNSIVNTIISTDAESGDIMCELLISLEKHRITWHDSNGCIYEYCELQVVKNDAGQWVVQVTRDDAELTALANECLARFLS